MIGRTEMAQLTPAQRAQVIYAQAQSQLSNRLWRAALGDGERDDNKNASPLNGNGMSMDSLLELLGNQAPPAAASGCTCQCACNCHAAGAAGSAAAMPSGTGGISEQGGFGAARPAANPQLPLTSERDQGSAAGGSGALALGSNSRYSQLLAAAEARSGVPAPALAAIVDAEAAKTHDGSWNPLSRNPRSSAAGLGQFLSGTWQDLARTPGTWLNGVARQHGWVDAKGAIDPAHRGELLAMRYDPEASILSVGDMAKNNLARLQQSGLNVHADSETLAKAAYLSHHLGVGDARKFLAGAIDAGRARTLLAAQIGSSAAEARIASAGDPVRAHRQWLLSFIERRIQPDKFSS